MIDLKHPLAVLGNRMPWGQIETALAHALTHNFDLNLEAVAYAQRPPQSS
jgi:hypothetical protein